MQRYRIFGLDTPILPILQNASAWALMNKFNECFEMYGLPLIDNDDGLCHGMTLLWLKKMASGESDWFYNTLRSILTCPSNAMAENMGHCKERLLDFFEQIDRGQNPEKYSHAEQHDTQLILNAEKQAYQTGRYKFEKLQDILDDAKEDGNMICISSDEDGDGHTIGVFIKNNTFFVYDSNDLAGKHQKYDAAVHVAEFITNSLYSEFDVDIPQKMSLVLTLVNANWLKPENTPSNTTVADSHTMRPQRSRT